MASRTSKTSKPPGVSTGVKRKRDPKDVSDVDEPKAKVRKVLDLDRRSYNWFLTWNNYDAESIGVLLNLAQVKSYCIQEEVGKDGVPHLQGVMVFKTNVQGHILNRACDKKCWWKTCRNLHAAKNYCSKVETASGKKWVKGFSIPNAKANDPLDGLVLFDWQKEIIEMISGDIDDRKVYWYWSAVGNVGKSVLCKHMVLKHDAIVVGGTFKDAYFAIGKRVEKHGVDAIGTVVFCLSRSQGAKVSYTAMEQIKDGLFFSAKYESQMCVYNPPHVLVFANCEPDLSQLSADRWVVKCLDKPSTINFNVDKPKGIRINTLWNRIEALANGEDDME